MMGDPMLHILIYDRDHGVRVVLASEVLQLVPNATVLTTGDLSAAKELVDRLRPRIVLTEAIPVLDCLDPQAVDDHDPGQELIAYIRQHPDPSYRRTWIIAAMSRLSPDIPQAFRDLIGELAYICQKPEVTVQLKDILPILVQTLTRTA